MEGNGRSEENCNKPCSPLCSVGSVMVFLRDREAFLFAWVLENITLGLVKYWHIFLSILSLQCTGLWASLGYYSLLGICRWQISKQEGLPLYLDLTLRIQPTYTPWQFNLRTVSLVIVLYHLLFPFSCLFLVSLSLCDFKFSKVRWVSLSVIFIKLEAWWRDNGISLWEWWMLLCLGTKLIHC